jgi:hypothetical protein
MRVSRISEPLTEAADRVWYATVKEDKPPRSSHDHLPRWWHRCMDNFLSIRHPQAD